MLQWLATIDGLTNAAHLKQLESAGSFDEGTMIEALQDGVCVVEALSMMEDTTFRKDEVSYDENDPYQAYRNYQLALAGLT